MHTQFLSKKNSTAMIVAIRKKKQNQQPLHSQNQSSLIPIIITLRLHLSTKNHNMSSIQSRGSLILFITALIITSGMVAHTSTNNFASSTCDANNPPKYPKLCGVTLAASLTCKKNAGCLNVLLNQTEHSALRQHFVVMLCENSFRRHNN